MKPVRAEVSGRRAGTRKHPKPETKLPISMAAVCIGVIAASAFALVWPHLEMVKIGYEVARLEKEQDILTQERRVLRVEIAALRQLDRIEMIARSRLGMVFPGPDQIVYVKVPSKNTH